MIRDTMTHADYTLGDFEILPPAKPVGTHGGAREGAGRKGFGYDKPPEVADFDKARARNEVAKASLNELDFKVKSGMYVSRDAVRQASATTMATLTQGLRSIQDNLERKGVPIDVCQQVGDEISRALEAVGQQLEFMAGNVVE